MVKEELDFLLNRVSGTSHPPHISYMGKFQGEILLKVVVMVLWFYFVVLLNKGGASVSTMTFSEFCAVGQPSWFGCSSQAQYLKGLFSAAGITRNYSLDYLKAVYEGVTKKLNSNMKKHFPKPVDEGRIAAYYEKHVVSEYVDALVDAFAIPANLERNKSYLCIALARQVAAFINSTDDSAECVVAEAYEGAIIASATSHYEIAKRLYDGDDLYVDSRDRNHDVNCYQGFTHEWSIQNRGRCIWRGRKLVCVNPDSIKPQIATTVIEVPETKPYEYIKIATEANSRGIEGSYCVVWEMQDANGKNCFPESKMVFDFTINVTFTI